MNDILARRARRATIGIALSVALAAGIAPATAIAAEASSPVGAVALQTAAANSSETAAAEKEKAYAAMQEALKNLEAAKKKIAEINDDIAASQELYGTMLAQAAEWKEPLPAMKANVDTAQAKYDEASNRVSSLEAELNKILKGLGDEEPSKAVKDTIKRLRSETMEAKVQEGSCKSDLDQSRRRLEIQEGQINYFESEAKNAKARIDENIAKQDALLGDLEKAQAASLERRIDLPESLPAPVRQGQQVGTLTLCSGDTELVTVPILAAEDAAGRSWGRMFTDLLKMAVFAG